MKDALMRVTAPVGKRPEPRWQWDEIAANDNSRMRNAFVVTAMLRAALESAQRKGPDAFNETKALVSVYLQQQEAEVFRGFELPAPECRMNAVAMVVKEMGEATVAAVQFAASPTPMNEAKVQAESMGAFEAIRSFIRLVTRRMWKQPLSV